MDGVLKLAHVGQDCVGEPSRFYFTCTSTFFVGTPRSSWFSILVCFQSFLQGLPADLPSDA
jgi:hypothetical protein